MSSITQLSRNMILFTAALQPRIDFHLKATAIPWQSAVAILNIQFRALLLKSIPSNHLHCWGNYTRIDSQNTFDGSFTRSLTWFNFFFVFCCCPCCNLCFTKKSPTREEISFLISRCIFNHHETWIILQLVKGWSAKISCITPVETK